jgi:hypothetical protein
MLAPSTPQVQALPAACLMEIVDLLVGRGRALLTSYVVFIGTTLCILVVIYFFIF